MSRKPRSRRRAQSLLVVAAAALLTFAAVLAQDFVGAGAQTTLSAPQVLPGDAAPAAAPGTQEQPRISKGADSYLAVWTDSRTVLNEWTGQTSGRGPGGGTLQDVYAARVGPDGRVIDTTPLILDQSGHAQKAPQVGWNGTNWLVVWFAEKPSEFSTSYEIRAARVSPAGQLLDPTPIVLAPVGNTPFYPEAVTDVQAGLDHS